MHRAITYIGKRPGITVRINKKVFEFEWQKSRGIGGHEDEIDLDSALKLSKRRDKKGKKIFIIE